MKRTKLKAFRALQDLTQEEMGIKLGLTSVGYGQIEKGRRQGNIEFWKKLKKEFNLSASEAWVLMTNEDDVQEKVMEDKKYKKLLNLVLDKLEKMEQEVSLKDYKIKELKAEIERIRKNTTTDIETRQEANMVEIQDGLNNRQFALYKK